MVHFLAPVWLGVDHRGDLHVSHWTPRQLKMAAPCCVAGDKIIKSAKPPFFTAAVGRSYQLRAVPRSPGTLRSLGAGAWGQAFVRPPFFQLWRAVAHVRGTYAPIASFRAAKKARLDVVKPLKSFPFSCLRKTVLMTLGNYAVLSPRGRFGLAVIFLASMVVAVWAVAYFLQTAPPRHIVLASGLEDGLLHQYAKRYIEILGSIRGYGRRTSYQWPWGQSTAAARSKVRC